MRTIPVLIVSAVWAVSSCAGPQAGPAAAVEAASPAKDAASYELHGLKVDRPTEWEFVIPDTSVMPDTVVILHGPIAEHDMRPSVEISRRELAAADRKRKAEHILTATALEIVQTFAAFETTASPADIQVAGKPASMMQMKVSEQLPDGAQVERAARFIVIVDDAQIWVVRCFGPHPRRLASHVIGIEAKRLTQTLVVDMGEALGFARCQDVVGFEER